MLAMMRTASWLLALGLVACGSSPSSSPSSSEGEQGAKQEADRGPAPDPDVVCEHYVELRANGDPKKKLSPEKALDTCLRVFESSRAKKPAKYQTSAKCIMKAKTYEDIDSCTISL